MNINDLMELVKAGFTKEEILALSGATSSPVGESKEVTATEPDVATVDDKAEVTQPEVTENATATPQPQQTNVNFAPMMTDAQVEKLAQMLNRGTATIDLPQPRNTDDILGEHFANVMLGKE